MWFAVRWGGLLNSDAFMAGNPWVFSHSCFSCALQWCRPSVWGRPPCGLQFTLLWLAILGFRVFGAVLASPGFVVTLHRHLSDSEVCEAMVFGGLVS
ncbi:hypothetical protein K438DRAFT_1812306 [Mycena galopus ATCC 62051]|nr:hypothetical protein K438DRAFT_1812306 [Mycena galopus ATCC 62051]